MSPGQHFQSRNQTALFPNAGMPQRCRCSLKIRSTLEMIAHTGLPKQMEEMVCLSLWRQRLGATVILRTVLETSLESGAGGVSSWQWRRVIPSTRLSMVSAIMVAASVRVLVKQHSRRASAIRFPMPSGRMRRRAASPSRRPSRNGRVVAHSIMIRSRTNLIITPSEHSSKSITTPRMRLYRMSSPKHL